MKEHIVITGASGLVGRALLARYLDQGHPVIALCRKPPALPSNPLMSWHWADVSLPHLGLDPATYAEVCAKARMVFHLAARTDFKDAKATSYLPVNLEGVEHALALAQEAGGPLHHVSTAFVCGDWLGEFREADLGLGQGFRNGYEESKFLGESFLHRAMATATPVPITVYRPGIVVERNPSAASGKTFGPFLFLDAVVRLREMAATDDVGPSALRVLGNRLAHLPLVFDDAVAEALVRLAAKPESAGLVFQLVAPQPVGNILLEDAFNEAFGQPAARFADEDAFSRQPANSLEALLARKTTPYAAYLDLSVRFTRHNLDAFAGTDSLPTPTRAELAKAFRAFLAARTQRSAP
ncbi:MAG: SDR family oxidoreductase [Deltaproteobacteria bacterium]|nr:SDR family oxidoreductase [Deltaproteobacteria bacterium]